MKFKINNYVPKTLKYTDNNFSSLNQVKRFDKHGNLIEIINAKRIDDHKVLNRAYGERECKVCKIIFTAYKKNQFTCATCIAKRPLAGLSAGRRIPLKSEKP